MLSIIKMTVSSTEFQQNVGYYLGLAEKGEEITISKSKPKKVTYTLTFKKTDVVQDKAREEYLSNLEKYKFKSGKKGSNGLNFQREVRS